MDRPLHPSSSNPNLFTTQHSHDSAHAQGGTTTGGQRPLSLHDSTGHDAHIQDMKLRDDFVTIAKSGERLNL